MMNRPLDRQVLVLNSSYEAIHICTTRRAIVLMWKGVADSVDDSKMMVHTPTTAVRLPAVIRLRRYVQIPYRPVPFGRKNVFLRDSNTCQYCRQKGSPDRLTLDHVVPVSRGGTDTWENVVTACRACNGQKGNRTPEEAGMELRYAPKRPHLPSFLHLVRLMGEQHAEWRKYLFYDEPETAAVI